MRRSRRSLLLFLLPALWLLVLVLSLNIGSTRLDAGIVLRVLLGDRSDAAAFSVIWSLRLPRVLEAALIGGALSVSGYLLQTYFRNPIAGPYVLGVSSGARFAVALVMLLSSAAGHALPFWGQMAAAFVGALLCTALVLLCGRRASGMAVLLLVGVMTGSIFSALTDALITFAQDADIASLHLWSQGSFSSAAWSSLIPCGSLILLALAAACLMCKPISAFLLGEEYALGVGVRVPLFRSALILLSCLLSACATALAGPVSFIGVAVPHGIRRLLNSTQPRLLLPGCFLGGGIFCMVCDLIARTLFSPTELSISAVTAVFGAPVVILLMLSRNRRHP